MTAVPPEGKFSTNRRAIALLLFVAFRFPFIGKLLT